MRPSPFVYLLRNLSFALTTLTAITLTAVPASASTLWNWAYSTSGITASGTLTTVDSADGNGGYLITGINGTRNGETITGLQPVGTSIPGNEPFVVDNLVFFGPGPQLTGDGFGFSTSGGNYSNPFYADFLPTPGYLEFFSSPPFTPGIPGPEDSEQPVQFSATPVSVPEPATCTLLFGALALLRIRVMRYADKRESSRFSGLKPTFDTLTLDSRIRDSFLEWKSLPS
jgi:hypothetical protein